MTTETIETNEVEQIDDLNPQTEIDQLRARIAELEGQQPKPLTDHEQRLQRLRDQVAAQALEIDRLTRRTKYAKDTLKEMLERLADLEAGQQELFDDESGDVPRQAESLPGQLSLLPDDPAKSARVVEALGLTSAQVDALDAVDVRTVWEFEQYLQRHGAMWFQSVEKIGEKTAEKILDAYNAWRTENPPPEEQADPEADDNWEAAIKHLRYLIEDCRSSDVPEAGREFAESVAVEAEKMQEWIAEHEHVTVDQWRSINNWRDGLAGWLEVGK